MSSSSRPPSYTDARRRAERIVHRLRRAKHEAYFVGGCVRDLLLKRRPVDYDIATSATPTQIRSLFKRVVPVGEQFGVMLVLEGGQPFEVATFRQDHGVADGRHPEHVVFTTAEDDVRRRDFTVNGLLYDPDKRRVIDYVHGRRDLQKNVIRAIGDPEVRFREDKLRMIRAIRFAARLGARIHPGTFRAIVQQSARIVEVSAERIRDELTKILTSKNPHLAFEWLRKSDLLKVILPEVQALKGVKQPKQFHPEGDVWTHTLLMLRLMSEQRQAVEPALGFGVLFHDIGKPPTFTKTDRIRFNNHHFVGAKMSEKICRRLKFSNEQSETIVALVDQHLKFIEAPRMRESTLKRFLRQPHFNLHMRLHYLDCMGSHQDLTLYRFCKRKLAALKKEPPVIKCLVNGHDLIRMGLKPGPLFTTILTEIENLQLEKKVTTRRQALRQVERLASSLPETQAKG